MKKLISLTVVIFCIGIGLLCAKVKVQAGNSMEVFITKEYSEFLSYRDLVQESVFTHIVDTYHLAGEPKLWQAELITMSDGGMRELYLIRHDMDKWNMTYSGILVDYTDNSSEPLFQTDKLCDEIELWRQSFYEFYDMKICDVDGNGEDDIILLLGAHGSTGAESYIPNLFCMIGLQENNTFAYVTNYHEKWLEELVQPLYDEDCVNWNEDSILESLKIYFQNKNAGKMATFDLTITDKDYE